MNGERFSSTSIRRMLKFSTTLVLVACILLHPIRIWVPYDVLRLTCLQPSSILPFHLYRLLTHAFIHIDFYHLLFNLISFTPLALTLEKRVGSLQALHLYTLFAQVTGGIMFFVSWVLSFVIDGVWSGCTAGLSSVVFALLMKECMERKDSSMYAISVLTTSKLFNLVTIPTLAYPWVSLLLAQFLIPRASFLGHLSGIAVGFACTSAPHT
jgi:rhomboid domain-containing protein 1